MRIHGTNGIYWVWPPPRIPVTTRIVTFLGSGTPINLHLPLLLGGGHIQGIYTIIYLHLINFSWSMCYVGVFLCYSTFLGGGFSPTHLKNMIVKLDHETPRFGVKIKIFELPPPSNLGFVCLFVCLFVFLGGGRGLGGSSQWM